MTTVDRSCLATAICILAAFFPGTSRAECGGNVQCIAVGPTPAAAAVAHHELGPPTFTLAFATQALGTASAAQTIFVEAVLGPVGTMARLGPTRISGAGAAEFVVTGGTCSAANGPVHGGAGCTITVAFRPTSLGDKTATVHVPLDPPACADCLVERTVTVTGFVGRPDPTRDATVSGVLAAQADAARRFAQAQITNAQGRMESLHRRGTSPPGAGANRAPPAAAFASLAASAVTVDVAGLAAALPGAPPSDLQSLNFWAGGIASVGARGMPGAASLLDFSTDGVSAGVDRAFGERLVAGLALGAARDTTDIGTDGSRNRARAASAMAYASFAPGPGLYIDTLVGAASLDFSSRRSLAAADALAVADRDGRQAFGSLAAGYERSAEGALVAAYARADYSRERLDATTEDGPAGFTLSYGRQDTSAFHGTLGLRAESVRETRFGPLVPRARLEYRHAFRTSGNATVSHADVPQDPPFTVAAGDTARNALVLGLGMDFLHRGGLKVGIDYRMLRASAQDSSQSILLNVSQALDGRGAAAWYDLVPPAATRKFDIQFDAGFGYDDNVSRARDQAPAATDGLFSASMRVSDSYFPFGKKARVVLAGSLGGSRYRNYIGLSRATADLEAEWQYRPSAEFDAPTLAVFAQAGTDQYESRFRDGYRYAFGATVRSQVTDRIGLFASLSQNRFDADCYVFDVRDRSARLNVDYRLGQTRSLYFSGEYRRGDIVYSVGQSFLPPASPGDPPGYFGGGVADDVFVAPQLFDFRVDGRTVSAAIGYNLSLGPRDSLDLSYRRTRSTPSTSASPPSAASDYTGTPRYTVNQFLLLYLMSF